MKSWQVIAFDADDTLWHNEVIFERVHARYRELLSRYHHDPATVEKTLFATEMRNLELYGYGIKGFTLSAIETAIELSKQQISADEVHTLLRMGREMMQHPVELLDGVADLLPQIAQGRALLLITKGDLRDQERKLAKSGIARHFAAVEIVSEKNEATYASILKRHNVAAADFVMIGNSLKSDIAPVLALGASAVYIPYPLTWQHERLAERPVAPGRYFELASFRDLAGLLAV